MAPDPRHLFEVKNIPTALSQLGIDGESVDHEDEFRGGQCHIFRIKTLKSGNLAAKIEGLKSELRSLRALEAKGFLWSPRCLGDSLTFDNPIKHPFLVLTWIDGVPLAWSDEGPPRPIRDKVLGQLAAIQLALVECTLETGSSPTIQYFERLARNRRTGVKQGRIANLSLRDGDDQQALLHTALGPDPSETAFAIDHGDLNPNNIIVDAEFNIQGIIDWGFAVSAPIQRAAGPPRLPWPPSLLTPPSPVAEADRKAYVASFATKSPSAASHMRQWQNPPDVEFCTLYIESLFSKGMHCHLAQAG